ncbi:branched-chain amino acid ABC transporter permease [Rhizobium sp. RU36D]|uniref:branched-chain amino acid ABC transporter permease n=1 Tax=Rhizobium sp. RU36D TaxID=1907415 RepID=UPI0009D86B05|nr:branched-chain amino acid ABC transporter permease [Rhizobium sp. RU36D]SMD12808.1 amino acid/amide ABC transporter membrane protein 2, HAAT family [Rhizobium sp. RU36D]
MKALIYILAIVAGLLLLLLPYLSNLAIMNLAIKIMIASIFALGFNLLWGQTGLPSFGHAAYYGIGTFATIYAMNAIEAGSALPTPLLPLVGATTGFAFGLVAGWFATIRSGVYFAMITVAIAELVSAISLKWEGLFGGEAGLRSMRSDWGALAFQSTDSVYWLTLTWMLVVMAVLYGLQRSPFGLVVRGIREKELRVRFLGYDTHRVKTLVFAISAAVSGLAGGLLAVSDESASMVLFQGAGSAFVVLNTIIGGAGVFLGPVIGAALTTSFAYFGESFSHFWMLYLGIAFVVTVMYAPQGIGGAIMDRIKAVKAGEKAALGMGDLMGLISFALVLVGITFLIEVTGEICSEQYRAQIVTGKGAWPPVHVLGFSFDPLSPLPWLIGIVALVGGIGIALTQGGLRRPALFNLVAAKAGAEK